MHDNSYDIMKVIGAKKGREWADICHYPTESDSRTCPFGHAP